MRISLCKDEGAASGLEYVTVGTGSTAFVFQVDALKFRGEAGQAVDAFFQRQEVLEHRAAPSSHRRKPLRPE